MMNEEIDAKAYIDALELQRNRAMNEAAVAMARSVQFQREAQDLRERLAAVEKSAEVEDAGTT